MSFRRLHLSLTLAAVFALGSITGCSPAAGPQVKVLGVSERAASQRQRQVVVFLQVRNPSNRPIRLSRLQYTFSTDGADLATGEIPLSRAVAGDGAAIVEIPIELRRETDGELHFEGKLYAFEDQVVRSWRVRAVGTLDETAAPALRTTTAPEPASVTAPDPASVTAPEPASVTAPQH